MSTDIDKLLERFDVPTGWGVAFTPQEAHEAIEAIQALRGQCEGMATALEVAEQFALEVHHAQSSGANWYTRGASGLYQQIDMWRRKADNAVRDALSAYRTFIGKK